MTSQIPKKQTIANKKLMLRTKLWPKLKKNDIWDRKQKKGFTTIPRTMPIFMEIMDSLSKEKVSTVYFELWCRIYDEHYLFLNNKEDMAFHAGFSGQRRVQSWTSRLDILNKLGFIKYASGSLGNRSYAVIINPYEVIKKLRKQKSIQIPKSLYNALMGRASEIGADEDI